MASESIAIANDRSEWLHVVDAELPIYSLAKPFIAASLFAAGVDIDAPISRWIDRSWVSRGGDITVAQLLNHTSGLRDYGALPEYAAAITARVAPWSDEVFADHTLRKPLLFEPGTGWSYANPGYWILSQIVQQTTGWRFETVIDRLIAKPLGLDATRVIRGQFADDLPHYPAGWVWHGVIVSTASDVVRFMRSDLVAPLLGSLVKVPVEHPLWSDPHNGFGLMVDPGIRYGHNGGGPGYSASCFHFLEQGVTGCVLMRADSEEAAMARLLDEVKARV